jgi:hypothetical protein
MKELDAFALVDAVIGDLVAQHMLGDADPHMTIEGCARLAKVRDHRGRTLRLHPRDARTFLSHIASLPEFPIMRAAGGRFVLPPTDAVLTFEVPA